MEKVFFDKVSIAMANSSLLLTMITADTYPQLMLILYLFLSFPLTDPVFPSLQLPHWFLSVSCQSMIVLLRDGPSPFNSEPIKFSTTNEPKSRIEIERRDEVVAPNITASVKSLFENKESTRQR